VLVCEVGLGGRLDATNLVRPQIAVITPISLEHTQVLGATLSEIAWEKGGVIKNNSVVVSAPQPDEAARVLRDICSVRGARLIEVERDVRWSRTGNDLEGQSFRVSMACEPHAYEFVMPLLGDYQLDNAATAVAALRALDSTGVPVSRQAMTAGFARVEWPGRFQVVGRAPLVLLDGAHTVASIRRLVQSIRSCLTYECVFLVVGLSCDKDIPGIATELLPLSPRTAATRSAHPRAAPPDTLARELIAQRLAVTTVAEMPDALWHALRSARPADLVCVTGSLFLVAEALDYLARPGSRQEAPSPPEAAH
ncbi:MAG: bifunctional folylpolyglutamate synthase/dihydrofolate synthase, partial [Chloroflexota bacterium]